MAWALAFGAAGAGLGWVIRWIGLSLRPLVHLNRVLVTTCLGALIGLSATAYQVMTDNSFTQVLFSGQDALPALVEDASTYTVGALILLATCKALAYGLSLSAFRGGPVFPAMFIGATLGIAASGLPGMSLAPAIAMGIGAMCTAMLKLPLTSTLLATLLLGSDGVSVTPQVVVAVAVAFVITMVLPVPGSKEEGPSEEKPRPERRRATSWRDRSPVAPVLPGPPRPRTKEGPGPASPRVRTPGLSCTPDRNRPALPP